VHAKSPYDTRGQRDTRNTTDGIYNSVSASDMAALTLQTTTTTDGYAHPFNPRPKLLASASHAAAWVRANSDSR
jgi:hypothetical protein